MEHFDGRMRDVWKVIGCGLALALLMAACADKPVQQNTAVEKLRPDQLKSLLAEKSDLFFLDVRSPQEIRELGTLPGYVNIPIDELEQRLSELPRNKTIVTA